MAWPKFDDPVAEIEKPRLSPTKLVQEEAKYPDGTPGLRQVGVITTA